MFKNIIKVTIRKIRKEFGYALLIVLSLTLGIASSLLLLLYVFDDLSFDQFHEKKDQIVRVLSHIKESDDEFTWPSTQYPFGPQAKQDYPEVEEFVRIFSFGRQLLIYEDVRQYDEDVIYADSSFFTVFTFDLLIGDPATVITRPNTMVVTESFAKKYFAGEDPYGKTIQTANGQSFEITGVMKDVPNNSHLTFSAVVRKPDREWEKLPVLWGSFSIRTYLQLAENTDIVVFQEKMKEMYDKYMAQSLKELNWHVEYFLEPLTDIYLKSEIKGASRSGDIKYVYIFSVVAFFMLLIASINYMNLATTRSIYRSREVGMRKIVGSQRWPLIIQFLCESVILTLIALIISIVIIILLFPTYNQITGKLFDINYLFNAKVILTLIAIVIFVGLLGGSYPAFYLSRFNPVSVIKKEIGARRSNFRIRKILVVVQFAISCALIINTWLIYKQLHFLMDKELGFDPDNIVIVTLENESMENRYQSFRNTLLTSPDVLGVSSANNKIGNNPLKYIMEVETAEGMQEKGINLYTADYDFIKTMGIEIVRGRDFSREFLSDTSSGAIINETMAKRFSWDDPIGKKIDNKWRRQDGNPPLRVLGVMKDFHQEGLYSPVETLMLMLNQTNYYVNIKIRDQNIQETLKFIEKSWSELFPDRPFQYTFLEDDYARQFKADEKKVKIFLSFSVLIILIACLGILGLVSFTTEQRTKEIGIRKAMGASVERIILLISKEFLMLVMISLVIAYFGAYFYLKNWLLDYAYPVKIDPWMFIGAGLLTIIILLITISYSTIKAGNTNPAESLKIE
jgi:putative ABC transport system permease protein